MSKFDPLRPYDNFFSKEAQKYYRDNILSTSNFDELLAADMLGSVHLSLESKLDRIFWDNTTDFDEPGCSAVEAYIYEHFPLIERVAPITHHLYTNQEAPFGRTVEGTVDLSEVISQLQHHYPEEFI